MSQPIRLTGISSGAKLQLVVLSRSPSVVSVALQLPETEQSRPGGRLMDKFPSTTTFWLLLRHFESTAGGPDQNKNFTSRAVPSVDDGVGGTGRLLYETPVIHIMGKELISFTDLQKTLAQLGYNSGSVLLRLSFRKTDKPLEEAVHEIDQYFIFVEAEQAGRAHTANAATAEFASETSEAVSNTEIIGVPSPPESSLPSALPSGSDSSAPIPLASQTAYREQPEESSCHQDTSNSLSVIADQSVTGPSQRPMTIFAPPSTSIPAAAKQAYNEGDYEPTIVHARLHQSRLAKSGRNNRIPTDVELAAEAEAQAKKNVNIKEVEIKIRFPDQSQVISRFSNLMAACDLHDFVRDLLEKEDEPFSLSFTSARGFQSIPREPNVKLISGLGMAGRILVIVAWQDGASVETRQKRALKAHYRNKEREIEVEEVKGHDVEENWNEDLERKSKDKEEGKERRGGMPKWLKLPGKK